MPCFRGHLVTLLVRFRCEKEGKLSKDVSQFQLALVARAISRLELNFGLLSHSIFLLVMFAVRERSLS